MEDPSALSGVACRQRQRAGCASRVCGIRSDCVWPSVCLCLTPRRRAALALLLLQSLPFEPICTLRSVESERSPISARAHCMAASSAPRVKRTMLGAASDPWLSCEASSCECQSRARASGRCRTRGRRCSIDLISAPSESRFRLANARTLDGEHSRDAPAVSRAVVFARAFSIARSSANDVDGRTDIRSGRQLPPGSLCCEDQRRPRRAVGRTARQWSNRAATTASVRRVSCTITAGVMTDEHRGSAGAMTVLRVSCRGCCSPTIAASSAVLRILSSLQSFDLARFRAIQPHSDPGAAHQPPRWIRLSVARVPSAVDWRPQRLCRSADSKATLRSAGGQQKARRARALC